MKPVRDLAVLASCAAVAWFQLPAKSASAHTSIDFCFLGTYKAIRLPCHVIVAGPRRIVQFGVLDMSNDGEIFCYFNNIFCLYQLLSFIKSLFSPMNS